MKISSSLPHLSPMQRGGFTLIGLFVAAIGGLGLAAHFIKAFHTPFVVHSISASVPIAAGGAAIIGTSVLLPSKSGQKKEVEEKDTKLPDVFYIRDPKPYSADTIKLDLYYSYISLVFKITRLVRVGVLTQEQGRTLHDTLDSLSTEEEFKSFEKQLQLSIEGAEKKARTLLALVEAELARSYVPKEKEIEVTWEPLSTTDPRLSKKYPYIRLEFEEYQYLFKLVKMMAKKGKMDGHKTYDSLKRLNEIILGKDPKRELEDFKKEMRDILAKQNTHFAHIFAMDVSEKTLVKAEAWVLSEKGADKLAALKDALLQPKLEESKTKLVPAAKKAIVQSKKKKKAKLIHPTLCPFVLDGITLAPSGASHNIQAYWEIYKALVQDVQKLYLEGVVDEPAAVALLARLQSAMLGDHPELAFSIIDVMLSVAKKKELYSRLDALFADLSNQKKVEAELDAITEEAGLE
jgi:hypothetical protein